MDRNSNYHINIKNFYIFSLLRSFIYLWMTILFIFAVIGILSMLSQVFEIYPLNYFFENNLSLTWWGYGIVSLALGGLGGLLELLLNKMHFESE